MCFPCRYLLEHGAQVGAVNSEGELPLDVASEDAMERLLKGEIKKQGEWPRQEDERDSNVVAHSLAPSLPRHCSGFFLSEVCIF